MFDRLKNLAFGKGLNPPGIPVEDLPGSFFERGEIVDETAIAIATVRAGQLKGWMNKIEADEWVNFLIFNAGVDGKGPSDREKEAILLRCDSIVEIALKTAERYRQGELIGLTDLDSARNLLERINPASQLIPTLTQVVFKYYRNVGDQDLLNTMVESFTRISNKVINESNVEE